jgi:hypothetical protein
VVLKERMLAASATKSEFGGWQRRRWIVVMLKERMLAASATGA